MLAFGTGAWLVGVPTAYYLGLHGTLWFKGIWIGMLCGYVVTSVVGFHAAFFGSDWDLEAQRAVDRSAKKQKEAQINAESEPLLP